MARIALRAPWGEIRRALGAGGSVQCIECDRAYPTWQDVEATLLSQPQLIE